MRKAATPEGVRPFRMATQLPPLPPLFIGAFLVRRPRVDRKFVGGTRSATPGEWSSPSLKHYGHISVGRTTGEHSVRERHSLVTTATTPASATITADG
jgi:hypothetical protein